MAIVLSSADLDLPASWRYSQWQTGGGPRVHLTFSPGRQKGTRLTFGAGVTRLAASGAKESSAATSVDDARPPMASAHKMRQENSLSALDVLDTAI